jgi:predicted DNA-binding antitoxin AbrB/MazE fold protein
MVERVEAIYENGQLRLLSPVRLVEGQRVQVAIETPSSQEALHEALGDLVAHWPDLSDDSDSDLESLAEAIDQALQGKTPLSKIIIEDRGET